jgi:hypothetical protein
MPDDAPWHPKAVAGLEVNAVADGYIIHQSERDRVHYLNHTAAILLELCTGRNAAADLAELLRLAYDLPAAPTQEVEECLAMLRAEGLVG